MGNPQSSPARKVKDLPDDGQIRERFLTPQEYELMASEAAVRSFRPWTLPGDRFEDLVELIMSDPPFNITLHTLRHTVGSWLAIEAVPLRAIRKLMGHRSITTTERYAHLSGENLGTAVERIEGLLPKSLPSPAEAGETGSAHTLAIVKKGMVRRAGIEPAQSLRTEGF